MKVLAIDIGGTKVASALIDENLNVTQRLQVPSINQHTPESFADFFTKVMSNYNPDDYEGVAVGTAGCVHEGHLTCLTPTSLGGLDGFPFTDLFKKLSGNKPVLALNDAQSATWAEYILAKLPNMCFITVSTGLGGGFIINDDLYIGGTSLAGHLGHALIKSPSPVKQVFKEFAIYEDLICGRAIAKATESWDKPCTTAEVFALQAQGDERADKVIKTAAEALAVLIATLVVTNDIRDYYLGGSVALNTNLIEQTQEILNTMPKHYHARLSKAEFGQDAVLVGVADYYFRRFSKKLEA